MNQFDKEEPRKNKKSIKKSGQKDFFDEEKKDQFRSTKSFKYRKRELESEDDDDWNNWKENYSTR